MEIHGLGEGRQLVQAFDNAGNTLGTARDIIVSSATTIFRDFVSSGDTNDFYRFSMSNTSYRSLLLNGLTANANVEVIQDRNNNGLVDSNEIIAFSRNGGTISESLIGNLSNGTY